MPRLEKTKRAFRLHPKHGDIGGNQRKPLQTTIVGIAKLPEERQLFTLRDIENSDLLVGIKSATHFLSVKEQIEKIERATRLSMASLREQISALRDNSEKYCLCRLAEKTNHPTVRQMCQELLKQEVSS